MIAQSANAGALVTEEDDTCAAPCRWSAGSDEAVKVDHGADVMKQLVPWESRLEGAGGRVTGTEVGGAGWLHIAGGGRWTCAVNFLY